MSQSFVDYARIHVKAGDGGNGCVAFRREKYVPRGGPNGGDGGDGGSVWLVADSALATLLDLKMRPTVAADRGAHGQGWQKTGRSGVDIEIPVPLGTVVSTVSGDPLVDLIRPGQRFLAAAGGKGGLGNQHFATSINQAPRKSTPGRPGDERALVLELKLIAQAGLIGLPNAGKSTLLAALTAATPKIAAYPFTTLHPNLGIMAVGDTRRVTLADIPGLIEGAVRGVGLGARFLRHIERTALLVHLIAPPDDLDPAADPTVAEAHVVEAYDLVRRELESYGETMAAKPEIVVLTKTDRLTPDLQEALINALRAHNLAPLALSAQTADGLNEFKAALIAHLDAHGLIAADDPSPAPDPSCSQRPTVSSRDPEDR
jgi:GTP-binding protein